VNDSQGTEILPTDTVMVTAWGYGARLVDSGIKRPVIRFNRVRVVVEDSDGFARAISPRCLSVLRRDGAPGFEHNRPTT
jgi:hypothetical protein